MRPEQAGDRSGDPKRQRLRFLDRVDEVAVDRLVADCCLVGVVAWLSHCEIG